MQKFCSIFDTIDKTFSYEMRNIHDVQRNTSFWIIRKLSYNLYTFSSSIILKRKFVDRWQKQDRLSLSSFH